jgi:hypothetical protein
MEGGELNEISGKAIGGAIEVHRELGLGKTASNASSTANQKLRVLRASVVPKI